MYSAVFVIFLAFIGSSIGQTNVAFMNSLGIIHTYVGAYVMKFSEIYEGVESFKTTDQYEEYIAQDEKISDARTKMAKNEEAPSVETVTTNWQTAANNVIDECTSRANQYMEKITKETMDLIAIANVKYKIKKQTESTMKLINADKNIIPQHKMIGCPIYEKLKQVNTTFGGNAVFFQQKFAPEVTPSQ